MQGSSQLFVDYRDTDFFEDVVETVGATASWASDAATVNAVVQTFNDYLGLNTAEDLVIAFQEMLRESTPNYTIQRVAESLSEDDVQESLEADCWGEGKHVAINAIWTTINDTEEKTTGRVVAQTLKDYRGQPVLGKIAGLFVDVSYETENPDLVKAVPKV